MKVAVVAGSESTARVLVRQLAEYVEGRAEIVPYWVDEGLSEPPEGDLVVLSSDLVRKDLEASGLLPVGTEPLVARRVVDCDALERVVALPPGLPVLFVNDRPETARDCVDSLRDLGLDGVDWLPWNPEDPPPPRSYRIAVVAGEPDLVPPGMDEVIDIGVRILDFGSLAEILKRLGMAETDIGGYSRRYLAKIVNLARRLARSTEEARRLSGHLGSVIDSLRHGILVYDEEGRVSVCNEELRDLLHLRPGSGPGAALGSLIRNRELLGFLDCRCGEEEGTFKLPEGTLVVRRFDLGEGGHTVAVFRGEGPEASRLGREYRRRGHVAKWTLEDIAGESEAVRRAKRIATRLAATDLSILIHGESGTGKELFASAIHAASARSAGPFLAVDLGALSDDLVESELFGYEEGAFTGAKKGGKTGLFELADGGTLFLDEIGNVSPKVQTRLLRVLQEKEVMRVGGADLKRVDVRVIAATNEDLLDKARKGQFREDLYFRLKMGWLRIPPLRERRQDIPRLVRRILEQEGAGDVAVSPEVLAALESRDWPGNVRELRNALTYMLAVREDREISAADLPEHEYFAPREAEPYRPALSGDAGPAAPLGFEDRFVLGAVAELEAEGKAAGRDTIAALARARGLGLGTGAARSRLERLAALGLLVMGRGRRGSRLTAEGRRAVRSVH
ncbi:MAG TPA: sigma 54-interacting transcriptional regulator [Spirochaetia bacterium]|nr:sigma 54-interacting transcriptional regulator [Spirochaetales bacterium]HRY80244.1 sigma 54-interacting transcriptional regulator [Spirochaetia bacterium]